MNIKIKTIYGVIPVPMIITDNLDAWVGGQANGPFIFVRPKYVEKNDLGLINHELQHVKQFYFFVFLGIIASAILFNLGDKTFALPAILSIAIHSLLYTNVQSYRLWAEVQAYKQQIKAYNLTSVPDWIVEALVTKYNLTYSRDTIKEKFN